MIIRQTTDNDCGWSDWHTYNFLIKNHTKYTALDECKKRTFLCQYNFDETYEKDCGKNRGMDFTYNDEVTE